AAVGAALLGLRPVVEMQFADFISNAFNQIVNVAATSAYRAGGCVPLVIRAPCGAGTHGGPFHSQSVEAYFFHTPGVKIVFPATPADAKGLVLSAIADPNPVLYLEHKALYRSQRGPVDEGLAFVPLGKADVRRRGRDLSVITYGMMVHRCLAAAEAAADESQRGPGDEGLAFVPLAKADGRRRGRDLSVITCGMMVRRCREAAEAAAADGVDGRRLGRFETAVDHHPVGDDAEVAPAA